MHGKAVFLTSDFSTHSRSTADPVRRIACQLVAGLVLLFAVVASVYAVDSLYILPTSAELNHRIERLEAEGSPQEPGRLEAVQILRQAIDHIDTTEELKAQAARYKSSLSRAPAEQSALKAQLVVYSSTGLPENLTHAPLTRLDALLTKEQMQLAQKRKRKSDIETEISQEKLLNLQTLLEQNREQLQLTKRDRDEKVASSGVDNAARILAIATVNVQLARIEMLEQRLLSRTVRLQLLETEQQLLQRQISDAESRSLALQTIISGHRQHEAERLLTAAKNNQQQLGGQVKGFAAMAAQNVRYAEQLRQLLVNQDTVLNLVEGFAYEAKRFEQKFTSLSEQLEITQLESSPAFGAALRNQRDNLADLDSTRQQLKKYETALTQSRLAQFQIDIEREPEAQQGFSSELAAATEADQQAGKTLLGQREQLLGKLSAAYTLYIGDLSKLIAQLRLLTVNSRQYTDLLDQQLLWMPSTDRLGLETLAHTLDSVYRLGESVAPAALLKRIITQLGEHFGLIALVLLVLAGMLQQRKRLMRLLPGMKDRVGKVHRDSIRLTLTALLITLLLALPGPVLVLLLAEISRVDGEVHNALARSLTYTAMVYFILAFVSQSLRSDGLAERHFKWDLVARHRLKSNLSWLKWSLLPLLAVNLLAEFQSDAQLRDSLGRISFIVAAVISALFFYRAFNPRFVGYHSTTSNSYVAPWQFRYFMYPLLFWPPVVLALLAVLGYYYSAVQLAGYLLQSLVLMLAGFYLLCLVQRAFAISERRLALDRAREKRAATLAEDSESTGDAVPLAIDLEKIDLQTISSQTDALLKMIAAVAIGLLLWNVWAEFFSAFQRLDKVALWQISEQINGSAVTSAITLWDLLLTVAVVVITFLAARNIPGLLEITLLSRLSLETGTNYAVTTICRYIIVITGSVIALQLLGAQWSKLQWLVAALSVGLGFGLQEIVANFVSGLVILFERPIRIGDTVTVGDQFGTVSRIRIRATTIVDWDRREVIIPNKTFITERLVNWTLTDPIMRTIINVGVAYGSDVALVEKCLLDIAKNNQRVLDDPPVIALFRGFGDSSLDFQLRVFIKGIHDLNPVIHELHIAIDREFRQLGIEIAFPQRDLHLDAKPIEVRLVKSGGDDKGTLVADFENDKPKPMDESQ